MHHRVTANLSLCILAAAHTGCMTAVAAFQPENIGGETIVLTFSIHDEGDDALDSSVLLDNFRWDLFEIEGPVTQQ